MSTGTRRTAAAMPSFTSMIGEMEQEEREVLARRRRQQGDTLAAKPPPSSAPVVRPRPSEDSAATPTFYQPQPAELVAVVARHLLSTGYSPDPKHRASHDDAAEEPPSVAAPSAAPSAAAMAKLPSPFAHRPSLLDAIGVKLKAHQRVVRAPIAPAAPPPSMVRGSSFEDDLLEAASASSAGTAETARAGDAEEASRAANQTLWDRLHAEGALESTRLRHLWEEDCRQREAAAPRVLARPNAHASRRAIMSKAAPSLSVGQYVMATAASNGAAVTNGCGSVTAHTSSDGTTVLSPTSLSRQGSVGSTGVCSKRGAGAAVPWRMAGPTGSGGTCQVKHLVTIAHTHRPLPSRRQPRSAQTQASDRRASASAASSTNPSPRSSMHASSKASPRPSPGVSLNGSCTGSRRASVHASPHASPRPSPHASPAHARPQSARSPNGHGSGGKSLSPHDADGLRLTRWRGLVCGWSLPEGDASAEDGVSSPFGEGISPTTEEAIKTVAADAAAADAAAALAASHNGIGLGPQRLPAAYDYADHQNGNGMRATSVASGWLPPTPSVQTSDLDLRINAMGLPSAADISIQAESALMATRSPPLSPRAREGKSLPLTPL